MLSKRPELISPNENTAVVKEEADHLSSESDLETIQDIKTLPSNLEYSPNAEQLQHTLSQFIV